MARLLKRTQPKLQQETPKGNMFKRFGGKFKKAFSKKQQSPIQKPDEAYVQVVQPEITPLPNSFAPEIDQSPTENEPKIHLIHTRGDEPSQISAKAFLNFDETASQKVEAPSLEMASQDAQQDGPSQDPVEVMTSTPEVPSESSSFGYTKPTSTDGFSINRNVLRRSNSVPSSSLSPTTRASGDTLYNTSPFSDLFVSPSLIKFRQAVDEHRGSSRKGLQTLAEHLKDEEKEIENTEWAALVEWIKFAHQDKLNAIKKDYAAEVEKLRRERSEGRRRLELRNRELRAMKREMKELRKSVEETTKDEEKMQPAPDQPSADESDADSVDQEEGGVVLANHDAVPTEKVNNVREITCGEPQEIQEADNGMRAIIEGTKQAKKSKKEAAEEKKKLQQALRQQLLEDSTPVALIEAGARNSAATGASNQRWSSQKAVSIRGHNRAPFTDVKDLQDHNRCLQANLEFTRGVIYNMQKEAESREGEIRDLKGQNHFAQVEVGYLHEMNANYRAVTEHDNPARTAHFDGLLKRKDEAYAELERRAAECADQLAQEKTQSAIDNVYAMGQIGGLEKELAHRMNMIEALNEGKKILREQNDVISQMFEKKIYQDDVTKALQRNHDIISKDNAFLIKIIQERDFYVLDAEKQVCDLKAELLERTYTAERKELELREAQQNINGLTCKNNQMTANLDIAEDVKGELKKDLESQLQQKSTEFDHLLQFGADPVLLARVQTQEQHITSLNEELAKVTAGVSHYDFRE